MLISENLRNWNGWVKLISLCLLPYAMLAHFVLVLTARVVSFIEMNYAKENEIICPNTLVLSPFAFYCRVDGGNRKL